MARKDVFKGTLESLIAGPSPARQTTTKSILQSSTLGAVENGLSRSLRLAEIDPSQIESSEFEDRLPSSDGDLNDLIESIRQNGQQIPILVQRLDTDSYRIIYGRRRLAAAKALGLKVQALITHLNDDQRVIAQGVENSVRRDLSFIEKAMFAQRLRTAGVDDATIRAALNIDVGAPKATTISTMKMVVEVLGEDLIMAIGRAPGIGRPRWRSLAELCREKAVPAEQSCAIANAVPEAQGEEDSSDLRFKAVFTFVQSFGAKPPSPAAEPAPVVIGGREVGQVRRNGGALMLSFKARSNPDFHAWLSQHAEEVIRDLHDRWTNEAGNNKEAR